MKSDILLVDDENIFNFITTKLLHGMGVHDDIHTALNGSEALDLLNNYFSGTRSLPRIIFLDINMPVMDGFGFIEAFKKINLSQKEKIVIAILTSSDDLGDRKRAKELGVEHYLTKPVSESDLRSVLEVAGVSFHSVIPPSQN